MNIKHWITSKTFWGVVITQVATMLALPAVGITDIVHAVGVVVAGAGVRSAIAKVEEAQAK